jgi:hypothetical protein
MIFGLVTFINIKLHPPSFIIRSAIHQAMTRLIFVHEVGKLGGGIGYEMLTNLYYGYSMIKETIRRRYILPMTTLGTWHGQYRP